MIPLSRLYQNFKEQLNIFIMKKIINLIFDRIERLLWFRHLLWTLRKHENSIVERVEYCENNKFKSEIVDTICDGTADWLHKHRNDYLSVGEKGKATGTENSTDVTDEAS